MTEQRKACICLGPGANATIVLDDGGSLRALERDLNAVGVRPLVMRRPKRAIVPLEHLQLARQGLTEWFLVEEPQTIMAEREIVEDENRQRRARIAVNRIVSTADHKQCPTEAKDIGKLDPHQVVAVEVATHPEVLGLCLFDEQGLGKTVTALFAFHRLRQRGEVSKLLIFAPKNMVLEWVRDVERFFGSHYTAIAVTGNERAKRTQLDQHGDIFATNFETALRLQTKLRQSIRADRNRTLLVIDESFYVKNADARRTRALKELRAEVRRCIVLCGTPAPNSPHDIVEQFNIADGGVAFRGVDVPEDKEEARSIISAVISERGLYLRRLKADVLSELPSKAFHRLLVPMEPRQLQLYSAALNGLISDLRCIDDLSFKKQITTFMARRIALLQMCSNPSAVVSGYQEVPAKLLALDSILEELIGRRGEKVVLWSFFTRSLEAVLSRYGRFNPVRVDGRVSDSRERREAVRRFQEDDSTMLFVGNPAAAGAGLTLHRARYAVYESMSNQAAHYLQSLDRIHRRGQERPVEYIVLLCDQTLEVSEYERLLKKEQSAQSLLGDHVVPPMSRELLLREAIEAAKLIGLPNRLGGGVI